MQVESTRMYRVKEVAEHFDVSVATIYRAIESGRLGSLRLGASRGAVRVPGSAVLAYAAWCDRGVDLSDRALGPTVTEQAGTPGVAGEVAR